MMKARIILLFAAVFVVLQASPQNKRQRFSPKEFKEDMEQFIAKEAGLTPKEAAKFFPVYDEMGKKQRAVYGRMRRLGRVKPADEKGCREAIQKRDKLELELKQIQQAYHNKFMSIIPASKLFDVIKAEDMFHRRMLKKFNRQPRPSKK